MPIVTSGNKANICVIMSVYNGNKYIKEQLDSIYNQDFDGMLTVYIRDDGAPEKAQNYLASYVREKGNSLIIENGINMGPSRSFVEAIKHAPKADVYILSDQDDIWKPGKIRAILEEIDTDVTPMLWFSNYDVVDNKLNLIRKQAIKEPVKDDLRVLFYNNVPGCVMAFNDALRKMVLNLKIDNVRMHDIMLLNLALLFGKTYFDNTSYVLYRQHSNNAVGYGHKKVDAVKWLRDKMTFLRSGETYYTAEYSEIVAKAIQGEQKQEYEFLSMYKRPFINRIKLLGKPYTKSNISRSSVSIGIRILLGRM